MPITITGVSSITGLSRIEAGAVTEKIYYVSNTGSDSNNGLTTGTPFQTIDKVNTVLATATVHTTILFKGGDTFNDAVLDVPASGIENNPIRFASYGTGKATISGGRPVTTWTQVDADKNIWTADFEETAHVRSLWVGDMRCIRARGPALPYGTTATSTGFDMSASDDPSYLSTADNLTDIELVNKTHWTENRVQIASLASSVIVLPTQQAHNFFSNINSQGHFVSDIRYVENNYADFLANSRKGTFYHNRATDTIYFIPPIGVDDPNDVTVTAGVREQILICDGQDYIEFENLILAHTTSERPTSTQGFATIQSNWYRANCTDNDDANLGYLDGTSAVDVDNSNNVSFENVFFKHLGEGGLRIRGVSAECSVVGCVFRDISHGGLTIGEYFEQNTGDIPTDLECHDNLFLDCGFEFTSAVALMNYFSADSTFAHNTIHDFPYTGISSNLGWGTNPTNGSVNNTIEFNHLYNGQRQTTDGGLIYINSRQVNCQVLSNYLHHCGVYGDPNGLTQGDPNGKGLNYHALYIDNGGSGVTMSGNVWHDIAEEFTLYFNDNYGGNVINDSICDVSETFTAIGPHYNSDNSVEDPDQVGLAAAITAGEALNAGITGPYSAILSEDVTQAGLIGLSPVRSGLVYEFFPDMISDVSTAEIACAYDESQRNLNLFGEATLTLNDVNGHATIADAGLQTLVRASQRRTFTLVLLVKRTTGTIYPFYTGNGGANGFGAQIDDVTFARNLLYGGAGLREGGVASTDWEVWVARYTGGTGGTSSLSINGVPVSLTGSDVPLNPGAGDPTFMGLGATGGNKLAYAALYLRSVPDAEVDDVTDYVMGLKA